MKYLNIVTKRKVQMTCAAAVVLLGSAGTLHAQTPEKTFACEVMTEAGVSGLAFAQSETMKRAKEMVMTSSALTLGGYKSKTTSIIQCIDTRSGRFSDGTMQEFYTNLPR